MLSDGTCNAINTRQENLVRQSGLDWTLVRPGALTNGPAKGQGTIRILTGLTGVHAGFISQADVAAFCPTEVGFGSLSRPNAGDRPELTRRLWRGRTMNNESDATARDGRAQRLVRRRTHGFRLPANTVCVTRPGKWGNPFRVGQPFTPASAVAAFCRWLHSGTEKSRALLGAVRRELRGKNLACWCPLGQPCHADVLLRLANAEDEPSDTYRKQHQQALKIGTQRKRPTI